MIISENKRNDNKTTFGTFTFSSLLEGVAGTRISDCTLTAGWGLNDGSWVVRLTPVSGGTV